eukprot:gnl/TRDRNA2_/TRDRNA2_169140_c0_seq1.p1 gnl/TRDRNA2_/TRDRNA2_169140_c0~~gnl/TRDRNA2_/TRDRNA2_169140_c0_seq1.p1  ORF type:complete len:537 (+),score=79.85 gnl/TRDRNA2_/TRDRNA2_169140_c0_seq1:154-1611(+)
MGFPKKYNDIQHQGRRANDGSWTRYLCSIPGVRVERTRKGKYSSDSQVTYQQPPDPAQGSQAPSLVSSPVEPEHNEDRGGSEIQLTLDRGSARGPLGLALQGLCIHSIAAGSPADGMFSVGDTITMVNDQRVSDQAELQKALKQAASSGERILFHVVPAPPQEPPVREEAGKNDSSDDGEEEVFLRGPLPGGLPLPNAQSNEPAQLAPRQEAPQGRPPTCPPPRLLPSVKAGYPAAAGPPACAPPSLPNSAKPGTGHPGPPGSLLMSSLEKSTLLQDSRALDEEGPPAGAPPPLPVSAQPDHLEPSAPLPTSSLAPSALPQDAYALDADQENMVLNCEDIGRHRVGGREQDRHYIDWDGVREAIMYYEDRGFLCHSVCRRSTLDRCVPPSDIAGKIVHCPVIDDNTREGQTRRTDRFFVLRLAEIYSCQFVDNHHYRPGEWELEDATAAEAFSWYHEKGGSSLKVEYVFDDCGSFVPLRPPPGSS